MRKKIFTPAFLVALVFVFANLYYLGGELRIPFTGVSVAWASTNSTCARNYRGNIQSPWCNCIPTHGNCTDGGVTCNGASVCKSASKGCGGFDCTYIDESGPGIPPCGQINLRCPKICSGIGPPTNTTPGSRNCAAIVAPCGNDSPNGPCASCPGVACP